MDQNTNQVYLMESNGFWIHSKIIWEDLWSKICFGLKEGQVIIIFELNGLLKNENKVNVVI